MADSSSFLAFFFFWQPLKKALRMMGAPNLIADTMDCGLSYSVISYLKKLSQQVKWGTVGQAKTWRLRAITKI